MKKILLVLALFSLLSINSFAIDDDLLKSNAWFVPGEGVVLFFTADSMTYYNQANQPMTFAYELDGNHGKLEYSGQTEDLYIYELNDKSLKLSIGESDTLKLTPHREEGFVYGEWVDFDDTKYIFSPDHTIEFIQKNGSKSKAVYYFHMDELFIFFDDRFDVFTYAVNEEKDKMSLYSSVIQLHLERAD